MEEEVKIKFIVEHMSHSLSKEKIKELGTLGINVLITVEDDITYITLSMKKGENL